ncbi:MAG: hypothetical protein WCT14_17065 [Treponemataceae bacterium]
MILFRRIIAILACVLAGQVCGVFAQSPSRNARSYWDAAVAFVVEGNKYLPGRMETLMEELDWQGLVVTSERSIFSLSYGGEDVHKPKEALLYAEKNGKDITEERRRNPATPPPSREDEGSSATPLDPAYQIGLELLSMSRQVLDGRSVMEISFEQPVGKRTYRGAVRVDAATGLPIDAIYGFKKLPPFVEDMETRIAYRVIQKPSAEATAGVVVDAVRFRAVATFIIVKKRVRGELRFLDHVKRT